MKPLIFSILFLAVAFGTAAQSFSPAAFTSGSSEASAGNLSFSFSLGQVLTPAMHKQNALTHGFQQPLYVKPLDETQNNWTVNLFPNPVSEEIHITLSGVDEAGPAQIEIYDMFGKLIENKVVDVYTGHNRYTIDMRQKTAGQYVLRIMLLSDYRPVGNFKVIKN